MVVVVMVGGKDPTNIGKKNFNVETHHFSTSKGTFFLFERLAAVYRCKEFNLSKFRNTIILMTFLFLHNFHVTKWRER